MFLNNNLYGYISKDNLIALYSMYACKQCPCTLAMNWVAYTNHSCIQIKLQTLQ